MKAALKPVFCSRVHHLAVKGNLGRGERIDENFFITNDRVVIESLLPKECEASVGRMEFRSLSESPVAVYARLDELPQGLEQSRLMEHLLLLDSFENVFWLHADSCVGHELAFLYDTPRSKIWSNIYEGLRSRSDTSQGTLTVTADTLRELLRLYRVILKPSKLTDRAAPEASPEQTDSTAELREAKPDLVTQVIGSAKFRLAKVHTKTNSNRISRALSHVGRAQKTSMLTEKVTFYCSAMEALFSTSQSELSHQIAERAVILATSNKTDRLPTYRFVKECYSFRSKYIHGASVKPSDELKLEGMSQRLDALVRSCFQSVLSDESLCQVIFSDGDLDEFMLKRLFE
jgi:Apea-like HEPN